MHKIFTVVAGVTLALLASCAADNSRTRSLGNPNVDGKTIAEQVCSTCHGVDGNSTSPQYPKLAGQREEYLVQQLKNFESHIRKDRLALEIMAGMSRDLTEKQAQEMARYFSSQPVTKVNSLSLTPNPEGKVIYESGISSRDILPCASCHGPDAKGQMNFPRLAGQHKQYLVKQLHVFKDTQDRPDTAMDLVVRNLSEKEIDALASYLSALNP